MTDVKTQSVTAKDAKLGEARTYAWMGAMGAVQDSLRMWSVKGVDVSAVTKNFIDREFRSLGYEESENPELLVGFLILDDLKVLETIRRERGKGLPELRGVERGALLIEVLSARSGKTLWLAVATAESDPNRDLDTIRKRLQRTVERLFWTFPE